MAVLRSEEEVELCHYHFDTPRYSYMFFGFWTVFIFIILFMAEYNPYTNTEIPWDNCDLNKTWEPTMRSFINKEQYKSEQKKNETMTTEKACRFDRFTDFGDCVLSEENLEHGFGFSKGQPCIMLKVNKIVGWYPKLKTPNNCTQGDLCCGEGIKFKCESDDDVQFEYYPKNGISPCYFPYANQKEYEQPYQMVKVTNLTFNKETTIECYPTDPSLTEIMEGKRNEARFHIKIKHDTPQ
uniref:Sodium/potassium-transporting ATPase subunit beta n=1 Tax=Caenorhabditis japonica TaxID=281687 RepID=A0A8R1I1P5_CAEJA